MPRRVQLIPGYARCGATRNPGALLGAFRHHCQISIERSLIYVDVERHQALCFGQRARRQRLSQIGPQIPGGRSRTSQLLAGDLGTTDGGGSTGWSHSDPDDDRLPGGPQHHRDPGVEAHLVGADAERGPRRSRQADIAALVAEAAAEQHSSRIQNGHVGANDRLAIDGLDDLYPHILAVGASTDQPDRRSDYDIPQLHESSLLDGSINGSGGPRTTTYLKDARSGFRQSHRNE